MNRPLWGRPTRDMAPQNRAKRSTSKNKKLTTARIQAGQYLPATNAPTASRSGWNATANPSETANDTRPTTMTNRAPRTQSPLRRSGAWSTGESRLIHHHLSGRRKLCPSPLPLSRAAQRRRSAGARSTSPHRPSTTSMPKRISPSFFWGTTPTRSTRDSLSRVTI